MRFQVCFVCLLHTLDPQQPQETTPCISTGHESWVLCVAAHPTGTAFFSGGSDSQVRVWDLAANKCSQVVKEHKDQVWAVAVRGDGGRVASVSDDRSIIVHKAG